MKKQNEKITYEKLQELSSNNNAVIVDTALNGNCQLWQLSNGQQFVVLGDNTVITRDEDLAHGDPIFPI